MALFVAIIFSSALAMIAPEPVQLRGSVIDEGGIPVPHLEVTVQSPDKQTQIIHTDVTGMFEYSGTEAGEYQLSLNKAGFFRVTNLLITLKKGDNQIEFTINHETEIHDEVEVYSSSESINPLVTSHSDVLIAREIRDIPVPSTHDLRSSLQTMPEVVRDNSGRIHIAGGRLGETQFILDGFDIGDPVTGELSVRVNVDSVRVAEAESGCYGMQYGKGGAGVLTLDTAVGDDRWRASANNLVPGVALQRGIHLTSWYPRFMLSGPIRKERAFFSESLSIQHSQSLVEELPPDADSVSQWAGDNLLRTQIKLTPKNILQASYLFNQLKASNLGLGPFSPISTTRDVRAYRSFFSLKEQVWSGTTFYELGFAGDFGHSASLPKGFEPYKVTPNGAAGNYFESLRQQARRWQGFGSVSMPTRHWHGTHDLQLGFNVAEIRWTHAAERTSIEVVRIDGSTAQHTDYYGPPKFRLRDSTAGVYAHDFWRVHSALVLQVGIRGDWDRIFQRATPSPRIAANFLPFKSNRTKLTAAWGVFLQPLTLSILGPAHDQSRSDTFYAPTEPPLAFGPVASRFVLPQGHLQQPRFYTTSLGWEQSLGKNSQIEFGFTRRIGRFGLAYERTIFGPPESIFLLWNNRRDQYQSLQVSVRHHFSAKTAVSGSYTRSSARTNKVFDYSLETVRFTPQQPGPLDWDAPNRFVSSGWTVAPVCNLFLSYFFEYRTGFPFSIVNERQQVIGPANSRRLPDYASLNFGIEKQLKVFSRLWAVRLTILNVTGHSNADSVINNIDSPSFLKYGGGQKRSFTARLRLIG